MECFCKLLQKNVSKDPVFSSIITKKLGFPSSILRYYHLKGRIRGVCNTSCCCHGNFLYREDDHNLFTNV